MERMRQPIFDPKKSGPRMKIACFVSGSGTNYAQIASKNPDHDYLVFTNRPECGGAEFARKLGHELVALSHIPYLREARKKYGAGKVPRNCPEREQYEKDVLRLIEEKLKGKPDLVCLAGYDQWTTDWMIGACYPRILNVHPGDTTKGYSGLGWVASAKAVLAGEKTVRSTLFIVDGSEDRGPILLQSFPIDIRAALATEDITGTLLEGLERLQPYAGTTFERFMGAADEETKAVMEVIGEALQGSLKVSGDWEIYPLGVMMIAGGEVEVEGRTVYVRGKRMPEEGYRLGETLG
jgi:folate-dependent phosphoribosylglycinamide formyltransferase PurN